MSFEYSEVQGNIVGDILSIKNPLIGTIEVDSVQELIFDDVKYGCKGQVIIKK